MNKWIAEFELEDGDTMPEHMNLEYKGAKIDFHCRPKEPILDKIRVKIEAEKLGYPPSAGYYKAIIKVLQIIDKYKVESEGEDVHSM